MSICGSQVIGRAPVGDGAAENTIPACRPASTASQTGLKGAVIQLGDVRAVNHAEFQVFPTQFLVGLDLNADGLTGFITDSGEEHMMYSLFV